MPGKCEALNEGAYLRFQEGNKFEICTLIHTKLTSQFPRVLIIHMQVHEAVIDIFTDSILRVNILI